VNFIKKLKEIWNKLKYWQKGLIIGLLFGIVYQIFILFLDVIGFKIYGQLGFKALHLIPIIFFGDSVSLSIIIVIWYGILGLFLGWIYKILVNITPKKYVFYAFLLVIIMLIITLIFIDLRILNLMFRDFG